MNNKKSKYLEIKDELKKNNKLLFEIFTILIVESWRTRGTKVTNKILENISTTLGFCDKNWWNKFHNKNNKKENN